VTLASSEVTSEEAYQWPDPKRIYANWMISS
jgi:hypothetical protein